MNKQIKSDKSDKINKLLLEKSRIKLTGRVRGEKAKRALNILFPGAVKKGRPGIYLPETAAMPGYKINANTTKITMLDPKGRPFIRFYPVTRAQVREFLAEKI